ncbi:hypothetical protein ACW0S9_01185, partial [Fusobacterium polymorphum]
MIVIVILLISGFAFEQKKLSFDYMLKIILIVGVCAYILYRDFSRLKNSYYSLNIKGKNISGLYKNKEIDVTKTDSVGCVEFYAKRLRKKKKEI